MILISLKGSLKGCILICFGNLTQTQTLEQTVFTYLSFSVLDFPYTKNLSSMFL